MNKEYEIYYEAFDIKDKEERRRFILDQCGDDKALFDSIMRLFADEDSIDDDTYGKYVIEKEIGKGGMGVVYLANYSESFGTESFTKQVALKTINPQLKLEPKNIKVFLNEIKTLAELGHPNIARFLDIGTSEKGKPFFVMEYVDGLSVIEHCNKNKFSINERLEFFRQILDAINYSHAKGFIHCDIKPNNILVDAQGAPKVIDFGISSKYGSFISGKNQTTFFQNAFTPNYASPEQIKGEKNLSEATDVYSLGVVLYELLTGQLPLELNESDSYPNLISTLEKNVPPTLKKSVTKVMNEAERERIILERDCQTISELKNNLSNHLDEIVQKALNRKPQKRYATIKNFDAEIGDYLNEESFLKQVKNAFAILYRKTIRKFRRISLKWAVGMLFGVGILLIVLSQSNFVQRIPYYAKVKFSSNNNQISLSNSTKTDLKNAIETNKNLIAVSLKEASETIERKDFSTNNVWSLANYVVALSHSNYPLEANQLDALFDKNATEEGCWKEEKTDCKMIISGWIMVAKKDLGKPISEKQLEFVLKNQSPEGWFPAYPYLDNSKNAATYPTAVILLGLSEQLNKNLIPSASKERVQTAITKGVEWILKARNQKAEPHLWGDCPNGDPIDQTPSEGVDGTIIYALHQIEQTNLQIPNLTNELKEIDSIWLNQIIRMPPFSLEHKVDGRCYTITPQGGIMDRTIRFSVPWSMMATIEAFPNGTDWQKATALRWLENLPITQEYKGYSFGQAEHLFALSHLKDKDKD